MKTSMVPILAVEMMVESLFETYPTSCKTNHRVDKMPLAFLESTFRYLSSSPL